MRSTPKKPIRIYLQDGRHGQKQGGAILPDMMRWLWRDQPVSVDVNDTVERSFRDKH